MNRLERVVLVFDEWQQRHPVIGFPVAVIKKFNDDQAGQRVSLLAYYSFVAAFPLLLTLTAIAGVLLRSQPKLQEHLVKSAFAEFPIVGGQIHQQLNVANFGSNLTVTVGVLGSLYGARGFGNALQSTVNTLWAVPKADWPNFAKRYLRMVGILLMLGFIVVVTGASSAAAATASSWGFHGMPARTVSIVVGIALGTGFFLALFRVAAYTDVPTRSMVLAAAISAAGWQLLLTMAGFVVAHQLRHAQAVAGFFGVILGLLAWLALQMTVMVYAIEIDVVRANRLWPRSIVQPQLTDADKSYFDRAVRTEARHPEQRLDISYQPDEAER
jgi:YihY family inner membrane protein